MNTTQDIENEFQEALKKLLDAHYKQNLKRAQQLGPISKLNKSKAKND
jgi:hypothetical protein